ncbi:hypothetical protein BAE44_0023153 [Dichanthelium oligosanthes]|uniref:DUF4220 domain-containing protein n=1 Tax=Dichanthelium oligosanthes TaxID=888268 RepID=A0A1E5USM2_9POAL|nr:hypothetical protein BAE44_0023153 [Dichanthelium oligosanthes]
MAAAAVLLFFQLICGSLRRRSNNAFIHGGLWVSYTLLPPLFTYTLGLMQSAQGVVVMYPVWALSLFLIAGGANSITAYYLDDNKQWKRSVFSNLQHDIYFCIILFQLLYPTIGVPGNVTFLWGIRHMLWHPITAPVILLFAAVCIAHAVGVVASWMVNYSYPSKVVTDYMKYHAKTGAGGGDSQEYFGPASSMKGCKYMVNWPAYKVIRSESGSRSSAIYKCELVPKEGVITVEMIWDQCGKDDFISQGVSSSRVKGACLAYSLSHLLRRRFFGMDCAEASLPETRRFILQGLLSENNTDEYTEAFRVIEVELAFLYDFFYTKYALIFGMEGLFFLMVIVKIICSFALGVLVLYSKLSNRIAIHFWALDEKIVRVPSVVSVSITVAIIIAFLAVEALQSILYLGSDWAMVSLACSYVTESSNGFIPLAFRKRFCFVISRRRLPLFSYWQKRLGQYSVIEGSKFFHPTKDFAFESSRLSTFIISKAIAYLGHSLSNLFSSNGLHFVKLPDSMKPMIVALLKSNSDGRLTNGKESLQNNLVFDLFSWTLQNETQTENMLVWHIATDYCATRFSDTVEECTEEAQKHVSNNFHVATSLSRYCAYLMSNVPELLPGSSVDTKFIFDQAMYEAREAFGSKMRDRDVLIAWSRDESMTSSILSKGLKLGAGLESIDVSRRWKVMADFWVETILYITPSDNAVAHMEHLARGGEFLTHLWALLTHAGILTRSQEPTAAEGNA